MVELTLRSEKGLPLTHAEVDANFVALRDGAAGGEGILNVRDFGCTGDGFTDDTEAFQAALDAMYAQERGHTQYAKGGRLRVPYGTYYLTRLNCFRKNGPGDYTTTSTVMEGDGKDCTVLQFHDPDVGLELGNSSGFNISNMSFQGLGKTSGQTLIVMGLLNSPAGTGTYAGRFENCAFGDALVGISAQAPFSNPGEIQGCSSEIRVENCTWNQCGQGFLVANYNALDFIFTNCSVQACNYGVYVGFGGGEVTWLGGSLTLPTGSFGFYIESADSMTIIGTRCEGSCVFLKTAGNDPHVVVAGVTVSNDSDDGVVRHTGGYLTLENCSLNGKVWVDNAKTLIMRQCRVNDTIPFNGVIKEGVTEPVYYRLEGCVIADGTAIDEVGLMTGGNNRTPFTFYQYTYSGIINMETSGALFQGLNGQTLLTNVASSDPGLAGQIWNDAGTLKISSGNAWSQQYKGAGLKLSSSATLPLMRVSFYGTPAGDFYSTVLGSVGKSTGKWYFECKLLDNGSDSVLAVVGVALTTMPLTGSGVIHGVPGNADSVGLFSDQPGATTGDVRIDQATIGAADHASVAGLGFVAGDVVQVAVDADADLIWFALNNTGTWNGGAGTPAAGTGGFSIAAITGTFHPACAIQHAAGHYNLSNEMQESVCWQGYFATTNYTAPTGFTNWA